MQKTTDVCYLVFSPTRVPSAQTPPIVTAHMAVCKTYPQSQ